MAEKGFTPAPIGIRTGYNQLVRGFSLIELIMVILLMGILAAIVIVQGPGALQINTGLAAQKIKSDIRYAQEYALSSQQRTRLVFSAANNNYSIYRESAPGNWALLADPLTKGNFTVNFGQGEFAGISITQVDFGGANNDLVFNAAGTPYGYSGDTATALASAGSVILSGGAARTVSVTPKTGRVSVQ